jgi:histidine phosphotransferase ChpT
MMRPDSDPPDALSLSALLASRLCHDLINPVGALDSGLQVLEEEGMDQGMKDAALDLVRSGGQKSVALLKFARLAYGAAGGRGAELPTEEAEALLRELFKWAKAELVWRVSPGPMPKDVVKTAMILAQAGADCTPRGGKVTVAAVRDVVTVTAEGPRLILNDEFVAALNGAAADLKPKFTPAFIAGVMARAAGGRATAALAADKVVLRAEFAPVAAAADAH